MPKRPNKRHNQRRHSPPRGAAKQETLFQSPFGEFNLKRFPAENDPTLRAWSAADELILSHLHDEILPNANNQTRLAIANDNFGAISIPCTRFNPVIWGDSYIAEQAIHQNLQNNIEQTESCTPLFCPSTDIPQGPFDLMLMALPKNHHYLSFQLEQIKQQLAPGAQVIASVMVKHFHPNALKPFEEIIGSTHTSLAVKKARLIIATNDKPFSEVKPLANYANQYPLDDKQTLLSTLPNVFSREKLDIGSRVLLPEIPKDPNLQHILDLGCGNGALGVKAAQLNPQAKITFCDESYLAIASAKLSAANAQLKNQCEFLVTDTLSGAPKEIDLILCNPPFHQQNSMHTEIAYRMFRQAHQHLRAGGKLLVVANRHLPYTGALKKRFKQIEHIADSAKFTVTQAIK